MSDEQTPDEVVLTVGEARAAKQALEDRGLEPKTYDESYVKELRQEAAKYRTEKNSAVEEAVAKVSQEWEAKLASKDEELAKAAATSSSKELELTKLKISMRALDQDTASRAEKLSELLKGEAEEDILASAKSAQELFGGFSKAQPAVDPTQGSGSGVLPLNGDPLLDALKRAVKL